MGGGGKGPKVAKILGVVASAGARGAKGSRGEGARMGPSSELSCHPCQIIRLVRDGNCGRLLKVACNIK